MLILSEDGAKTPIDLSESRSCSLLTEEIVLQTLNHVNNFSHMSNSNELNGTIHVVKITHMCKHSRTGP